MNAFFSWQQAIRDSALEPTTKLVCYTIGVRMAGDGSGCYPSYSTIAKESGLNRATVIRHVHKAVEAGYLELIGRTDDEGETTSNLYRPLMPEVVAQDDHPGRAERPPLVAQSDPNYPSLTTQLRSTPVAPNGFDEFWAAYPNKVGKPKAQSAWRNLKAAERDAVMEALPKWKDCRQWVRDGGQFIPHPTTFLNQRRWEDDPGQKTPVQSKPITDMEIPM